jgi:aspartate/methionine/tyrosine aminotransferase
LIGIAISYLRGKSALVFEPYYSYHRRILEEFGGKTEAFELDENLTFEKGRLAQLAAGTDRPTEFPLKAIIVCSPQTQAVR